MGDADDFGEKIFDFRTMNRWIGSTAIVTGASSGIGAAVCERLLKMKINVVGVGRNLLLLEELAKRNSDSAGRLYPFRCDLRNEEELMKVFEFADKELDGFSILVYAAGVLHPTTLMDGSTQMWQEMMDVNFTSLAICINEATKSMQTNDIDGHIISINCYCGHAIPYTPFPSYNFYACTKYAQTALVENVRLELRHMESKIKISMISPDVVNTVLNHNLLDIADTRTLLTKGPTLNPADVADACAYVLGTPPNVDVHDIKLQAI